MFGKRSSPTRRSGRMPSSLRAAVEPSDDELEELLAVEAAVNELLDCGAGIVMTCSLLNALERELDGAEVGGLPGLLPAVPIVLPSLANRFDLDTLPQRARTAIDKLTVGIGHDRSRLMSLLDGDGDLPRMGRAELAELAEDWRLLTTKAVLVCFELEELFRVLSVPSARARIERLTVALLAANASGMPCREQGAIMWPDWAQKRRHRRFAFNAKIEATWRGGRSTMLARDVSAGGLGLIGGEELSKGMEVTVELPGGRVLAGRVAWVNGIQAGIEFDQQLSPNDPLICAD